MTAEHAFDSPLIDTAAVDPSVVDPALVEAQQALRAARALPLADQPAALEAVHAALSTRLGDVQNA